LVIGIPYIGILRYISEKVKGKNRNHTTTREAFGWSESTKKYWKDFDPGFLFPIYPEYAGTYYWPMALDHPKRGSIDFGIYRIAEIQ